MSKLTVKVAGMSCASCAARIEKSLAAMDGVQAANVNFAMERLTVEFDPGATNIDDRKNLWQGFHNQHPENSN